MVFRKRAGKPACLGPLLSALPGFLLTGTNGPTVKKISLQHLLVFPILGLTLLSVALVGYVSMRNGQQAVHRVAFQLRNEIDTRIVAHLNTFLAMPHRINQANAAAIGSGIIDVQDQAVLERYFWEQARIFDSVTSINFSNTAGGLVNAGREGYQGSLYVIVTDNFVSGPFKKYATDSRGSRAELLETRDHFDGRKRTWYMDAAVGKTGVWGDVYILFTGQDMSICASLPVYDPENRLLGVTAVDMFLSHISDFLSTLRVGETGQSFIMERSGLLVAASTREKPFTGSGDPAAAKRIDVGKSTSTLTRGAAKALTDKFGSYQDIAGAQPFTFTLEDRCLLGQVTPFTTPYGLDWLIVTIIPQDDFTAPVTAGNRATFMLMVVTMMAASGISIFITRKITGPVSALQTAARALSLGNWDQKVQHHGRIAEISTLTDSFNDMAKQLKQMFTGRQQVEKKYQTLVENLSEIVYTLDDKANITYVSKSVKALAGYDPKEIIGRNFLEFVHPEDMEGRMDQYQKIISGVDESSEYRFMDKQGRSLWIKTCARPVMEKGKVTGIQGVLTNISELKEAEARIRQLEKAESLDRMAGAIAHNYNNLLSAVMGNLELALVREDMAGEGMHTRELTSAMNAARRAAAMGEMMLTYLGQTTRQCKPLNFGKTCRLFLSEFEKETSQNVTLKINIPASELVVMANAGQIHQLMDHVMKNALEAMEERTGHVVVGITRVSFSDIPAGNRWPVTFAPQKTDYVCLVVKDQGTGIMTDSMEKIFDPFYSTRFIGRGLGLSMALSIVKSHDGCITVQSRPGKGSVFQVFIPLAAVSVSSANPQQSENPNPTGQNETEKDD